MILTLGPISEICKFLPAFEAYTLFIRLHPKTNKIIKQFPNILWMCTYPETQYDHQLYELLVTRGLSIE